MTIFSCLVFQAIGLCKSPTYRNFCLETPVTILSICFHIWFDLPTAVSGKCPENANWYWIHTMERVGDSSADFEPEMTAEMVKDLETESLMNFQNSEDEQDVREVSLTQLGERKLKNNNDGLTRCKKDMISEPVSITHYILNEFENGIIFNFYENSNVEINILFPLNLSIDKIKGNVSVKDINGQTNIVIMEKGEIRNRSL